MEIDPIINYVGILNHFTNHTKGSINSFKKQQTKMEGCFQKPRRGRIYPFINK